jgi:hypothetical protein
VAGGGRRELSHRDQPGEWSHSAHDNRRTK